MGAEFSAKTPLAIKRGIKRTRMSVPAKLLTATGQLDVRLRDLSRAGALAETARPPAAGSEVVLVCGQVVTPASVAWAVGRRAGLEFHSLISDADVLAQTGTRRLG